MDFSTVGDFIGYFYATFMFPLIRLLKETNVLGFSLFNWVFGFTVFSLCFFFLRRFFGSDTDSK